MSNKTMRLIEDTLVFVSPYDKDEVTDIKKVPGAKWDRVAKAWRAPVTSLVPAREFAQKHGFEIHEDIQELELPKHRVPSASIEQEDKRIFVTFPYDPVKVKAVKRIPGAKWHPKEIKWSVPLSVLPEIVEYADTYHLEVPDGLRKQLDAIKHERLELKVASRAEDADIRVPNLAGELKPFQRAGVAYAIKQRRAFIADEMGLGKTLESMAAVEHEEAYPCLVVAPPTLLLNWENEISKFLPHRTVAIQRGRSEFVYKEGQEIADFTLVGWSNLAAWEKKLVGFESLILDESHMAKNGKAQRTKAAIKISKNIPEMVLLLTGTPITSRPVEYAAQLKILGVIEEFGGEWGFLKRYCAAHRDSWGNWDFSGASHLDELNDRLRSSCYVRRTKGDVMKELDPIRHQVLVVEPDPKVMVEYRKAEDDIAAFMARRAAEIAQEIGEDPRSAAVIARLKAEAAEHLVRVSQLKQIAAKAKKKAVEEWIESTTSEGLKVVVAAHHRDVVSSLANMYGGLKIQGQMKLEQIEEAKRRFQEESVEDAPVIVLSIQAAKTGHTLTAAQNVLMVEEPWTPSDVDQTIARCHRIGQEGSVLATHMLARGTVDEEIYGLIEAKRRVVDAATEGGVASVAGASILGDIVAGSS